MENQPKSEPIPVVPNAAVEVLGEAAGRRLVRVAVSFDYLLEMMKQGFRVGVRDVVECVQGVPADAICVGSDCDAFQPTAYLIFRHPSFSPVESDQAIPELTILFKRSSKISREDVL